MSIAISLTGNRAAAAPFVAESRESVCALHYLAAFENQISPPAQAITTAAVCGRGKVGRGSRSAVSGAKNKNATSEMSNAVCPEARFGPVLLTSADVLQLGPSTARACGRWASSCPSSSSHTVAALQPEHLKHSRLRHGAQFRSPGNPCLGICDLSRRPDAARTRCDRDELLAVNRIGHRRCVHARPEIDVPQRIQSLVVEGDYRATKQRRNYEPLPCRRRVPSSSHPPTMRVRRASPWRLAGWRPRSPKSVALQV